MAELSSVVLCGISGSARNPLNLSKVLPNFSFRKCWELGAEVEMGNGAAGKSQPLPQVLLSAFGQGTFLSRAFPASGVYCYLSTFL